MSRILSYMAIGTIVLLAVLTLVSVIFSGFLMEYYIFWLLHTLFFTFIALVFIYAFLFMKLINIEGKAKIISVRIFGVLGCAAVLAFTLENSYLGMVDIGAYITKEYNRVEGVPIELSHMSRSDKTQTIKVGDVKLLNAKKSLKNHLGEQIEFYYLPKTKFVVKMKVIE